MKPIHALATAALILAGAPATNLLSSNPARSEGVVVAPLEAAPPTSTSCRVGDAEEFVQATALEARTASVEDDPPPAEAQKDPDIVERLSERRVCTGGDWTQPLVCRRRNDPSAQSKQASQLRVCLKGGRG